jgi:hypothetical protein
MRNPLSKFFFAGKNFHRPNRFPKAPAPIPLTRTQAGRIWKIFWTSAFWGFLGMSGAQAQFVIGQFTEFIPSITNPSGNPTVTNVTIIDTLPTDVVYVSCSGAPCAPTAGGAVVWDVGNVPSGTTISVTVTVQITTCNTNTFYDDDTIYYGSPPVAAPTPVPISYTVACNTNTPTPTPTITFTPTLTPTATITNTPTVTLTPTNSFTPTLTPTPTNSFTPTNTFTVTNTPTITDTFTPTATFTPTCPINVWPDPYSLRYAHDHALKISCLPPNAQVYIYDVSGELVNVISQSGDPTEWQWAKNQNGATVSPGIYFYAIKNGQTVLQRGKFLITP